MLYHVMSRGNDKQDIFLDNRDYERFLAILATKAQRFGVTCGGYCAIPNHVHMLLVPGQHSVSRLLQQLNSQYCQWFNRRHGRLGHRLQGRFESTIVDSDVYFLRVVRYVLRNPVEAGLVEHAADWRWSSYHATAGLVRPPAFLDVRPIWSALGPAGAGAPRKRLDELLAPGTDEEVYRRCLIIGSEAFARGLAGFLRQYREIADYVHAERFAARPPLSEIIDLSTTGARNASMQRAYDEFGYTLKEIGVFAGCSGATVWARIRKAQTGVTEPAREEAAIENRDLTPAEGQISIFDL